MIGHKSYLRLPHTLTLFLFAAALSHGFTGDGTEDSPYLITSTDDMAQLAADVNNGTIYSGKYFRLENNLDFSNASQDENGNNYTPIGYFDNIHSSGYGFAGTFDGNNKTIYEINVTHNDDNGTGLFGYTASEAVIKNVKISNCTFNGNDHVGGLVGRNSGAIENVYVKFTTIGIGSGSNTIDSHGGIVGTNLSGHVKASISKATVNCSDGKSCRNFGGIVGNNSGGSVSNNLYLGSQVQGSSRVGWIAGQKSSGTLFNNFYPRSLGTGGIGIENSSTGADVAGNAEAQHTIEEELYGARLQKGSTTATYSNGIKVYDWGLVYNENENESYFFNSTSTIQLYYYGNDYVVTGYTCNGTGCSVSGNSLTIGTGDENGITYIGTYVSGTGTSSDPYLIPDETAWNFFADAVSGASGGYCTYEGKFFKLTNDISVSTMVGHNSDDGFRGTFDGDGHTITVSYEGSNDPSENLAPFVSVNSATIKNLHTAGTINTSGEWAAGIVSRTYGSTTIENCHSSVAIHSSKNVGESGGLIGTIYQGQTTIKESYFDGQLLGNTSESNGGLIGWVRPTQTIAAILDGVLFKPTKITMSETGSYTLYRADDNAAVTCSDCYYTQTFGEAQGAQLHADASTETGVWSKSITAVDKATYYQYGSVNPTVEAQYNVGIVPITPAPTSIQFEGIDLELNTDYTIMYIAEGSDVETNNISQAGNYTMVIRGKGCYTGTTTTNITVTEKENSAESPYLITSADDWDYFAKAVNNGNTFQGKFLELDADITASTTVSDASSHPFAGTFDGKGHTITANISADGTKQGTSLFRYISGATIKNLTVAGTISGVSGETSHTSGLVGFAWEGVNTIENVTVSATVQDGNHVGGFVGHGNTSTITFRNCVFSGTIKFGSQNAGGFLGWTNSGSTLNIENCLFKGTFSTSSGSYHPLAVKNSDVNLASVATSKAYYTVAPSSNFPSNRVIVDGERVYSNLPTNSLAKQVTAADSNTYYQYTSTNPTFTIESLYTIGDAPITPSPTITYKDEPLTQDADYTVRYKAEGSEDELTEISANGNYTMVISGIGEFVGTKTLVITVLKELKGDGSENAPFEIASDDDWNVFANRVNKGESFNGLFLKLMDDISVTTMAGSSTSNYFAGTFDGNEHTLTITYGSDNNRLENFAAPFRYVNGATVKNLHTTGAIFTKGKYAAGIMSRVAGTTTIDNCHSDVVITSYISGDGTHGGLAGTVEDGNFTLSNSWFSGELLGANTNNVGGLVGWINTTNGIKGTLTNCLFKPAQVTMGTSNSQTFYRYGSNPSNVTISQCYYTATMGATQGHLVTAEPAAEGIIYGTNPVTAADGEDYYLVATITGLQNSYVITDDLEISPVLTAGGATLVKETDYSVTYPEIGVNGDYTITVQGIGNYAGTFTQTANFYGKFNGEGTETDPYIIATEQDWNAIVQKVSQGETFSGKFLKMAADISVTEMIGSDSTAHYFAGTFDGDGHTLTVTLGNINNAISISGPFRYINGATIKSLHVGGNVNTRSWNDVYDGADHCYGKNAAGLVGFAKGNNVISNVIISASITAKDDGFYITHGNHGGIVGLVGSNANVIIKNSVFNGEFIQNGKDINGNGGFVGGANSTSTISIENSLFNPTRVTMNINYSNTFGSWSTVTNSYYTSTAFGTNQGIDGSDKTPAELAELLGYAWHVVDDKVVPYYDYSESKYGAVTVVEADGSTTGYIDGMFNDEDAVNIPTQVKVDTVVFNRTFSTDGYSTITLPFTIDVNKIEGIQNAYEFYAMGLDENGKKEVQMTAVDNLTANTPYIIEVGNASLVFQGSTVLEPTQQPVVRKGDWEFRGTLQKTVWDSEHPDLGRVYGYSAEATEKVTIGQFVKAAAGAWIRPLRAYLIYNPEGEGLSSGKTAGSALGAAEQLPETMDVVVVDRGSNGEVSKKVIGTIDTRTGEFRMDRWYDMQGRRLNGKPTAKGTYYHNGKSVIIR